MNIKRPTTESRQLSLRVPTALHEALSNSAADHGLTLAGYIKYLAAKQLRSEQKQANPA